MHPNEILIRHFYEAFARKDYKTMQDAYHEDASFSDPVFHNLSAAEARAMWKMLLTSAKDLTIAFDNIRADDREGACHWEARYTFSGTGRKVHNIIKARFEFSEGKILRHDDDFSFWKWSRMALGGPGWLMGWSPYLLNAVRRKVKGRLKRFIEQGS